MVWLFPWPLYLALSFQWICHTNPQCIFWVSDYTKTKTTYSHKLFTQITSDIWTHNHTIFPFALYSLYLHEKELYDILRNWWRTDLEQTLYWRVNGKFNDLRTVRCTHKMQKRWRPESVWLLSKTLSMRPQYEQRSYTPPWYRGPRNLNMRSISSVISSSALSQSLHVQATNTRCKGTLQTACCCWVMQRALVEHLVHLQAVCIGHWWWEELLVGTA